MLWTPWYHCIVGGILTSTAGSGEGGAVGDDEQVGEGETQGSDFADSCRHLEQARRTWHTGKYCNKSLAREERETVIRQLDSEERLREDFLTGRNDWQDGGSDQSQKKWVRNFFHSRTYEYPNLVEIYTYLKYKYRWESFLFTNLHSHS